jgi:chemosensory pili system protein ChpA (sensor histidine kinase/response regulator)
MEFPMKPLLLIAETDAELRDVYRTYLTRHGYEVETASDGLECLNKLRQMMPAVLVLDRELRWGGGDGVLACLREERATHGVSVILMVTDEWQGPAHEFEPVIVKCLPKPFALTALLVIVRVVLAEKGQVCCAFPMTSGSSSRSNDAYASRS